VNCIKEGVLRPLDCDYLYDFPVAAIVACAASCPDQTADLVTDVPCREDLSCVPSPGGFPLFCDFQLGPDAGGYCAACDLPSNSLSYRSSMTSFGEDDYVDKCRSCPEPCVGGSFCGYVMGCKDCIESGIMQPQDCEDKLRQNKFPDAAREACAASCPDRTATLVTNMPCREDLPCAPSPPDGSLLFCDFKLGPKAGGYCVQCNFPFNSPSYRFSLTSLGEDDYVDKCDSCPEPCGEGSFCSYESWGCVDCIERGIMHPSQCNQLTDYIYSEQIIAGLACRTIVPSLTASLHATRCVPTSTRKVSSPLEI